MIQSKNYFTSQQEVKLPGRDAFFGDTERTVAIAESQQFLSKRCRTSFYIRRTTVLLGCRTSIPYLGKLGFRGIDQVATHNNIKAWKL